MTFSNLPEIYFIRHGQTGWNREGRYQGQRDIPLNATGRRQADANGVLLRELFERGNFVFVDFDWIASPLGRTRETMKRIRAAFTQSLPDVHFDDRLVEVSFGRYEGLLASEMHGEGPAGMQLVGHRDESFWHYTPQEGESYDDVASRVQPLLEEITAPSVIVAHGGVARVFRHLIEGLPRDEAVNWSIPHTAILHFVGGRMTPIPSGYSELD